MSRGFILWDTILDFRFGLGCYCKRYRLFLMLEERVSVVAKQPLIPGQRKIWYQRSVISGHNDVNLPFVSVTYILFYFLLYICWHTVVLGGVYNGFIGTYAHKPCFFGFISNVHVSFQLRPRLTIVLIPVDYILLLGRVSRKSWLNLIKGHCSHKRTVTQKRVSPFQAERAFCRASSYSPA